MNSYRYPDSPRDLTYIHETDLSESDGRGKLSSRGASTKLITDRTAQRNLALSANVSVNLSMCDIPSV